MMAIADQQNRRRARHQQYQSEQARNLAGLIGAVDNVGEEADADAMAKAKAEALASDTGARKTNAEAALLRAKTAAGANADSVLRKKTDDSAKIAADEAKAAKLAREESVLRRKESTDVLRMRAEGGASPEDLINVAKDDENLGELDDDAVRALSADVASKKTAADAKIAADEALAEARTADAEKKRRAPTGGKGAKAVDPEIAAAKKRSALAQADKDEADAKKAARDAAGDGKPVKPLLTPAEVVGVTDLQQGLDIMDRLTKLKTSGGKDGAPIDTGPFAEFAGWFAKNLDMEDAKKTEFKALAGENVATYIKSISGATVSEPERKNLLENVPTPGDHDDRFMAKLKMIKDTLDAKLRIQKKAFAATGRDTAIFGEAPAAPKKPADMSDADIEARLKELKAKR
jgi:hypothetical protein